MFGKINISRYTAYMNAKKQRLIIGFDGSRSFVKNKTGTENYAFELLKNLALLDRENSYKVYLRPGCKVDTNDWPENFHFIMIPYKRLWTQIGLALKTFTDDIDLLFSPAHTVPLFRKPGLKTVMTVHDLGSEYLPGKHQLKQRLYLKAITKFQMKGCTKLIAVSQATADDLFKKVGVRKKKVAVIYEGLNAAFAASSHESKGLRQNDIFNHIKKRLDINNQEYFFFVGTVQPRKNIVRLIEAFDMLLKMDTRSKAIKLVIAGSKGWHTDDIYALPQKLGIKEQVIFAGRVSDEEMVALYKHACAFTFPSLFEGFGLPILEAMSLDCPVLTSNSSSMPEVGGKAAIYVDPLSVKDIYEGLQKMLDPKVRKAAIEEGRRQYKKFTWEKCAKETLQLFKEVAND